MREKPVLVRSYQRAPSVQRDAADHWELPKNVHHIEHSSTLSVPSVREQCALVTTGKTPTARPRYRIAVRMLTEPGAPAMKVFPPEDMAMDVRASATDAKWWIRNPLSS
jgi:hypothetical protein